MDHETKRKLVGLLQHHASNAHNMTMGRIPFQDHRTVPAGMSESTESTMPNSAREGSAGDVAVP